MKSLTLFFLLLLACSSSYGGDILFIDLNNVIPEVEVIQEDLKNAKSRNEEVNTRLVIVPSMKTFDMETRVMLQPLSAELNRLMEKSLKNLNKDFSPQIYELGQKIRKLKTGDPKGKYTKEEFFAELESVVDDPSYNFDRVFISGHHGSNYGELIGVIGGELVNSITSYDLKESLNYAISTQGVYSLVLLGCKTGIDKLMGKAGIGWASVLPWSKLQFGFNGYSPIKSNPDNLNILKQVIAINKSIGSHLRSESSGRRVSPGEYITKRKGLPQKVYNSVLKNLYSMNRYNRYLGFRLNGIYHKYPQNHFVE
jgi:hypothetical protein